MTEALEVKKLVIIGDGAVGKTALLYRFEKDTFDPSYVPTIFSNSVKKMEHPENPGQYFNLQLWDTAGQEDYAKTREMCYPGCQVICSLM